MEQYKKRLAELRFDFWNELDFDKDENPNLREICNSVGKQLTRAEEDLDAVIETLKEKS